MKIILAALNAKYVHSNLAVHDLYAYAKLHESTAARDLHVREYTINQDLDLMFRCIYEEKADLIAFSSYIWNIREILTIAEDLKKVSPQTMIWLGGPEVSYNAEELLEKHSFLSGVMSGEGEKSFAALIKAMQQMKKEEYDWNKNAYAYELLKNVPGIAYRKMEEKKGGNQNTENQTKSVAVNPPAALLSMDEVPFIYQDLKEFEHKIIYYETSRGCPFSCSYCLSSIDKTVRFRSLSLVEKELQFFLDHKVPQVKFIDRTFNCKKSHSRAIWDYITKHDNGVTNFHFEISADLLEEEDIELFRKMRPGLIQLEIGLQSVNVKTISEIRRVMNIEKLASRVKEVKSLKNIHEHLDLIAGLPYEDYESFQKSFDAAYAMKPDQLQLGFLKVLKGSYMKEQEKNYGLVFHSEPPYEVMKSSWITYDELLKCKLCEEMTELYYNSSMFSHVLSFLEEYMDSPFLFYEKLGEYYKEKGYLFVSSRREKRYEILREYVKHQMPLVSMKIFDFLLHFDYVLREKPKTEPSWKKEGSYWKEYEIDKNEYQTFFKERGNDAFTFTEEAYDSKTAARSMQIEKMPREVISYIKEELKIQSGELPEGEKDFCCLFDYEKRDPLSNDASVWYLDHIQTGGK